MTRRPRGRRLAVALTAVLLAVLAVSSAPPAARASVSSDAEWLAVDLINAQRANRGLVPLRRLSALGAVSGTRAGRMRDANTLSHSVGGSISGQLAGQDIDWYSYGEAIGYSYGSWASGAARDLVRLWMGSSAHRALLMSARFNYIGVGLAYRSSNHRTFGSVMLTEFTDISGAKSWMVRTAVSGDDITWTWSGADVPLQTHMAGLRDYDVQYRIGSGGWMTVRNDSPSTTFTLANRPRGVTYGVHVRATDRRGNTGAWTTEYRVTLP